MPPEEPSGAPPAPSTPETKQAMPSPKPPVAIAVIGAGIIGPRHAQSIRANPSAKLVALVDPSPQARDVAASMDTAYFDSVASLLAGTTRNGNGDVNGSDSDGGKKPPRPDAAIICTPNNTHVPLAKTLLSAGVHVLVENPLSADIPSGRSLLRLAASLNQARTQGQGAPQPPHLLVGHHRRFSPYILKAKEIVTSGCLGTIHAINGLWTAFKPPSYFDDPTTWRRETERGGGVLLLNLVHDIDILHYLLGPIVRVYAERAPQYRTDAEHTAEEGAAVTLRFASGAVGTFLVSDATPSPFNFESGTGEDPMVARHREGNGLNAENGTGADFYRVFGSDATLSVPDMRVWSYYGQRQKSWAHALTVSRLEVMRVTSFDFQVQHLVDVVRGECEPLIGGGEAMRALVVCDAIKKSMERGVPVEVEKVEGTLESKL